MTDSVQPGALLRRYLAGEHEAVWAEMTAMGPRVREAPHVDDASVLDGEPHETTFVNYLRIAFRWGGFPGWERHDKRPERELKFLTEGLLPI